jgi:hypothetical protein
MQPIESKIKGPHLIDLSFSKLQGIANSKSLARKYFAKNLAKNSGKKKPTE